MSDELDIFSSFDFGFNADAEQPAPDPPEQVQDEKEAPHPKGRQHRKTELFDLTPKYE